MPAAESVRSTSADSALIWVAASAEADDQRGLGIAGAGQDRVRRTGADRGERAFDFRRGQLQLCADIGGNRQQRLLRGAGAGLNGLAGIDHEVGQRALGVLDMGPDAGRQFLGARHQAVAGLPSAALDAAGHGFDARAQQVLELRDADVDIGGDGADPGFDALMDFLESRRDGVGQLGAAAVDGLGDIGDALVDGFDRLRGARVSEVVRWVEARVDRLDRLRGAVGQRRGQLGEAESIEWIACAAPSVSDDDSVPSRSSMVSVTDLGAGIEGLFERFEAAVDRFVERLDLAVERGVEMRSTRLPSVVSNCTRRWSSEAVISPPFEVRRVSKLST